MNIKNILTNESTLYKTGFKNKLEHRHLRLSQSLPIIAIHENDIITEKNKLYPYKQLFETPSLKKKLFD